MTNRFLPTSARPSTTENPQDSGVAQPRRTPQLLLHAAVQSTNRRIISGSLTQLARAWQGIVQPATSGQSSNHGGEKPVRSRPTRSPATFLFALDELGRKCRLADIPLSIIKIDLNRFHECNIRWSPKFGDTVLRWFDECVRACTHKNDLVGRLRCDRYVIARPHTVADSAETLVDRIRTQLRRSPPRIESRPYAYSVRFGIARSGAQCRECPRELLRRARAALDHAEREGGNRVVMWDELVPGRSRFNSSAPGDSPKPAPWVGRLRKALREARLESTWALVAAVDAKDRYTQAHSINVARHAVGIAKCLGLAPRLQRSIRAAALLHDVGKIGVPDFILTKDGPLTNDEFAEIKRHPEIAVGILAGMRHLSNERPMILHHHERFDGSGYPARLSGDDIPLGARIITVADAIDTMLSARSYKSAYSIEHTRAELADESGRQFDPHVVSAALQWLDVAHTRNDDRLAE